MNNGPAVAKTVWTEADFDAMDWHDNAIHAIAVEPVPDNPGRLLVDLDYIVGWVSPTSPSTTLDFWICPATLVFDPAWDLTTDRGRLTQLHAVPAPPADLQRRPLALGRGTGRIQLRPRGLLLITSA
jgi:hypothetical protein